MEADKNAKTEPAPIPLANAWAILTLQEVEKRPFSYQPSIPITTPATVKQTMEVSTKPSKPTARHTKNHAKQKVRTSKGGTRPTTNHQCMDKAVRIINERISYSYVSEQDKTVLFIQSMPTSKPQTQHQQTEEEQMDDALETIHIALIGEISLLRKISIGNTRLVHALKKII